MAIILNKKNEVLEKLQQENKVVVMDTPDDIKNFMAITQYMEEVHRDYQIKDRQSQVSASGVVLTT